MASLFVPNPDDPASVVGNVGAERELIMTRWGMPPSARRRLSGDQYPQFHPLSLAGLAEAGKPMPGPGKQLRGIGARARHQKKPGVSADSSYPAAALQDHYQPDGERK
jgi:hypothetical protein